MSDPRQTKIMLAQFRNATKENNEFIKFALKSETETGIWYVLLSNFAGNEKEFEGGEYLCRMETSPDFPFSPPRFYMMTKNGVYDVDKTVCISIGEYHAKDYRPTLGMAGFASQLVSGLIGWQDLGKGIALLKTSVTEKKQLAENSKEFNYKHYPYIMKLINESYENYSSKWKGP